MVHLRDDRNGPVMRFLQASLDSEDNLVISGHDLGPGVSYDPDSSETEWRYTIRKRDLPKLIGLLSGKPGDDIIELLATQWTGPRAQEFETILYDSGIEKINYFSWP